MHSKYDLVAFAGIGDGCTVPNGYSLQGRPHYSNAQAFAREIKSYSPETIVLGKPGYSPLNLYDDAPADFFVMKDRSTVNTQAVSAESTSMSVGDSSFFYDKPDWLAFIGDDAFRFGKPSENRLEEVRELDASHPPGSTVRQPLEVFGYLPNLMPFNPKADYREVARMAVDQRYRGITAEDLRPFDGIFYSEFRDRILCADEICGASYWGVGDWGADFDNDGVRDCDCDDTGQYRMSYLDEQWHIGVKHMFRYEREVLQKLMPGKPLIIVTNSGDYPDNYMAEVVNGYQLEYLRKIWTWGLFVKSLRYWEEHAPKPHAIVIIDTVKENEQGRDDFAQMRYGLATAMMGDAYYGRNFGSYHYIGMWYDEFETDLGYPLAPPVELDRLCTDPETTGIQPDWGTYECVHIRFFDKGAVIVNPTASPQTVTVEDLRKAWQRAGFAPDAFPTYHRFLGGQDPDFNNGERFSSVDLRGDPGPAPQGAGDDRSDAILLFTHPVTAVADIVVGNWRHDDTSPGSEPVELDPPDQWRTIAYSNEKYGANPYYTQWVAGWTAEGTPYFYTTGPGKTATFRPTIGVPGNYEVYEWHGWHADKHEKPETHREASNIRAVISYAGGETHVTVDQTRNEGQWNYLGTYPFARGKAGYVRYTTDGSDGVVIADAVMFRFAGSDHVSECEGDLNKDGAVDVLDLQSMVHAILNDNPNGLCADLDGDADADVLDLQLLVSRLL